MSNEELSMRRFRPRWLYVLALYFGLLAAGCETVDGGPAAAALLRQKEAPPMRGPAADLFAELDQALDAAERAQCGNDSSCEHVKRASARLAELGPRVIPTLLHRMVHAPEDRAEAVIGVFGEMKKRARPAVPTLVALLEDAPPPVRHRAVKSLRAIGVSSAPVLDALVEIQDDEDQDRLLRRDAGWAIVQLTAPANGQVALDDVDEAIAALRMLLEDGEDPALRREAVHSLANIRPATEEVLDGLIGVLHDQDAGVRAAAASELNRLKGLTQ
jgi:HEAT repeat protein